MVELTSKKARTNPWNSDQLDDMFIFEDELANTDVAK